jgi:hypothetical protein
MSKTPVPRKLFINGRAEAKYVSAAHCLASVRNRYYENVAAYRMQAPDGKYYIYDPAVTCTADKQPGEWMLTDSTNPLDDAPMHNGEKDPDFFLRT